MNCVIALEEVTDLGCHNVGSRFMLYLKGRSVGARMKVFGCIRFPKCSTVILMAESDGT
jgi:hypothetical protein